MMIPKSTIAVHVTNKIITIGWRLIKKMKLYNGFNALSRLKRKLNQKCLRAIDCIMFPDLQ